MSTGWADVDRAPEPLDYVRALEATHRDARLVEHADRLVRLLDPRPGESILDLGTGVGWFAGQLLARGAHVLGVDSSMHMLRYARADVAGARYVCGDVTRLPLHNASVDGVLVAAVLQHVPDVAAVLREARRVLVPGGRLVSSDSDVSRTAIDGVDARAAAVVAEFYSRQRAGRHAVANLRQLLARCGFVRIQVTSTERVLRSLDECDGMYGVVGWGAAAVREGLLEPRWEREWERQVRAADEAGTLRLRLGTVVAHAVAPGLANGSGTRAFPAMVEGGNPGTVRQAVNSVLPRMGDESRGAQP